MIVRLGFAHRISKSLLKTKEALWPDQHEYMLAVQSALSLYLLNIFLNIYANRPIKKKKKVCSNESKCFLCLDFRQAKLDSNINLSDGNIYDVFFSI